MFIPSDTRKSTGHKLIHENQNYNPNAMKSSWAISCIDVELVSKLPATIPVSIIRVWFNEQSSHIACKHNALHTKP
jgi:predicted RNA-binding protein with PUA-like domain